MLETENKILRGNDMTEWVKEIKNEAMRLKNVRGAEKSPHWKNHPELEIDYLTEEYEFEVAYRIEGAFGKEVGARLAKNTLDTIRKDAEEPYHFYSENIERDYLDRLELYLVTDEEQDDAWKYLGEYVEEKFGEKGIDILEEFYYDNLKYTFDGKKHVEKAGAPDGTEEYLIFVKIYRDMDDIETLGRLTDYLAKMYEEWYEEA